MGKDRTTHRALTEDLSPAIEELVALLDTSELESLTINSIMEHRRLLDVAERAYATMRSDQGHQSAAHREAYVRAMLNNKAQLAVVNLLVDRLGYVPHMPEAPD